MRDDGRKFTESIKWTTLHLQQCQGLRIFNVKHKIAYRISHKDRGNVAVCYGTNRSNTVVS